MLYTKFRRGGLNMSFEFFAPTRVLFGQGSFDNLSRQKIPGDKALVVISNGKSAKENGYLEKLEYQLKKMGIDSVLFDKIEANPLKSTVMDGAKLCKQNNCDIIVALGGGSVMDAAKAIAAMASNDGDLWDYISGGTGKSKKLKNAPLPIIAITTTAGTGSEVDQWGVISNEETKEKIGFGGYDSLFPVLAIVDPELMKTVPPEFTAYQGFDALFHSTEVYISKFSSLMSDMTAQTAIESISQFLAKSVKDGNDMIAREKVAFGNTISGYSMVVGCTTSEHSIEHAMSAYHHKLPHGAGLIMISLAYYTYFIKKGVCSERFIKMAKFMGMQNATKPMDFIYMLNKLQRDCNVSDLKMSDYGIVPDEFPKIAENAKRTMSKLFTSDPIPLSQNDVVDILQASYK